MSRQMHLVEITDQQMRERAYQKLAVVAIVFVIFACLVGFAPHFDAHAEGAVAVVQGSRG